MNRIATALDTEGGVRLLWWLIGLSVAIGFAVFLLVGANGPKNPSLAQREHVEGFGTLSFTIQHGAATDDFCALLAGNDQQRETGMMGRHDLGGYDAMVFAWPRAVSKDQVYFYNRKVPIALSVAWFDDAGKYIGSADMDPCADIPGCPTFKSSADYKYAIEVPKGDLGRLGVGRGAVFAPRSSGC